MSLLICDPQLGARRKYVLPTIDILRIVRVVLLVLLLGTEVLASNISSRHSACDEERTPLLWPRRARGGRGGSPVLSAREMLLKLERSFQPRSQEHSGGIIAADSVVQTGDGSPATVRKPLLARQLHDVTPSEAGSSTRQASRRSSCYWRTCSWKFISRPGTARQTLHEPEQRPSVEESNVTKNASTLTRGFWKPDAPEFVPQSSRCQTFQSPAEVECRNFHSHTDPTVILRCPDQGHAPVENRITRADANYAGRSCSQACATSRQKNACRATSS